MTSARVLRARPADPPLDPRGDDARSQLRRELARPEYHETDLLRRIFEQVQRFFQESVDNAADAPPLATFAAILVALALALALSALVARARRTARGQDDDGRPALGDERVSARELRARADAAFAAARWDDAVVDGFRALAVRQVERDRIEDLPQATAPELARQLGSAFAERRPRIDAAADVLDSVLYGDHPADRDQAVEMLALDDELAGRAVRR